MTVTFGAGFGGLATAKDMRSVQVTKAAAASAAELGLDINAIIDMARRAVPLSGDEKANRRFKGYCFFVAHNTVYGVWPYAEPEVERPVGRRPERRPDEVTAPAGYQRITAVCPLCEGEGCAECRDTGKVTRTQREYDELVTFAQTGA